jgi:hypothetical protein
VRLPSRRHTSSDGAKRRQVPNEQIYAIASVVGAAVPTSAFDTTVSMRRDAAQNPSAASMALEA